MRPFLDFLTTAQPQETPSKEFEKLGHKKWEGGIMYPQTKGFKKLGHKKALKHKIWGPS
jgi:hypothetical protein